MSIDALPGGRVFGPRSLRDYVAALLDGLAASDPDAIARIRAIVGTRRARISLDAESVEVFFEGADTRVVDASGDPVDGEGRTTRGATLDLLEGYLEVAGAVIDGRLDLVGTVDSVVRMGHALEILLDGAARSPAMQELARNFRAGIGVPPPLAVRRRGGRRTAFYPDPPTSTERRLLAKLDLLP